MRHDNWTPEDTTYVELARMLNNDTGGTKQNLSVVLHWSTSIIKTLYIGFLKMAFDFYVYIVQTFWSQN